MKTIITFRPVETFGCFFDKKKPGPEKGMLFKSYDRIPHYQEYNGKEWIKASLWKARRLWMKRRGTVQVNNKEE